MEALAEENFAALEAKLRNEFQQAATKNQADIQKALMEKDALMQNQRASYEAIVQATRDELLEHVNNNDTFKGELAASKLRREQAERDMVLREFLVAKNATEALKHSEQQFYSHYIS